LPAERWVLHTTPLLGNLTDRWIDVQARNHMQLESRLLGMQVADGARRSPHWLVAADRFDLWISYRGMFKSAGLSPLWLTREFRGNPPIALHVHYGPPAAQLRHFARSLDVPLIASFYGYDATKDKYSRDRVWRRRYRRLFDQAAAFVVEGPAMKARLVGLGCSANKVEVVRLPADVDSLSGAEGSPARDRSGAFVAAIAGTFVEKKGHDTAIRAFARALRGRHDARLLVIGGGRREAELRLLARDEGIADQTDWTGFLPHDRFASAISEVTVGLYPSRRAADGDSEGGAPVTLIEAQWLGVPAIVSDHDDLPFVAAPDASIVLPALDVDRWAEALQELYEHPDRAAAMGSAAQRFVRDHHSPATNVNRREAIYLDAYGA
jgi:colanic acid/amylovoran biosynthesis glycosyltransferase